MMIPLSLKKLITKKRPGTVKTRITYNAFVKMEFDLFRAEKMKVLNNCRLQDDFDKDRVASQCKEELCISLENSKTQKQFIMKAKEVWSKFSASQKKHNLRRPSEWRAIIPVILDWYEKDNRDFIYETELDSKLIKHVKAKQPRLNAYTIRKYVRLFRLTWTPPWNRTKEDWEFLAKNAEGFAQDELEIIREILRQRQEDDWMACLLRESMQRIPSSLKCR